MSWKVKSQKRHSTWLFIIVFLLGAVFAELTADPISDYLFFSRASEGTPMSPFEQVMYWYFIPAGVYLGLLLFALFVSGRGMMRASDFTLVMVAFAGVSLFLSWRKLGGSLSILVLLSIPLVALVLSLTHKLTFKSGRRKVSL